MTTANDAMTAIRARLDAQVPTLVAAAGLTALPMRWPGEEGDELTDEPSPFAFIEFMADGRGSIAGYGDGRGANLYRNPASIEATIMTPIGWGAGIGAQYAECIAAAVRSWRSGDISVFDATTMPGGDKSDDGNYFITTAIASLTYDQIG